MSNLELHELIHKLSEQEGSEASTNQAITKRIRSGAHRGLIGPYLCGLFSDSLISMAAEGNLTLNYELVEFSMIETILQEIYSDEPCYKRYQLLSSLFENRYKCRDLAMVYKLELIKNARDLESFDIAVMRGLYGLKTKNQDIGDKALKVQKDAPWTYKDRQEWLKVGSAVADFEDTDLIEISEENLINLGLIKEYKEPKPKKPDYSWRLTGLGENLCRLDAGRQYSEGLLRETYN